MKFRFFIAMSILVTSLSCSQSARHTGIPVGAQSTLETSIEDIDNGRIEKIYYEASDEWRNEATLDESKATFQKLQDRLGKARTRTLQTEREDETSTAPVPGHSITAIYHTSFDRGEGMESFTLVERGGQWYLARYYVSSNALK